MTNLTDDLVEGTPVKIGRQVLIVPALNFKALRMLKPQLAILHALGPTTEVTDEVHEAMVDIVHTALKRNYPNLSREDLEDGFDLSNRDRIVRAVMGQSGMTQSGEGKPAAS
jgi:hypothetical protein